jgi:hypothetical protein
MRSASSSCSSDRNPFRPDADGRSFHLVALDEGRYWEARVKRDLSDTIFGIVFPELIRALKDSDPEASDPPTPRYLSELREAALTFLYRLLFTLYAEDRELLPRSDPDYDDYGLSKRVRDDIAERIDRADRLSATQSRYYDSCRSVFDIVNRGDESVGVPPYNGGLFASDRSLLLNRARVPDQRLAPLIDALSRTDQEGRRVRINYRDLSVRELGAVYERLLEHEPAGDAAEPSGIAIRLNPFARKGSGSYYTPDELVGLIIERTIGPLVEERIAAFEDALTEPSATIETARRKDAAEAILSLKVVDPAMGSGHFLVALVDYLADAAFRVTDLGRQAFGNDYQSPVLARAERIGERIRRLAAEHKWKLRADMIDDKAIIRRMVLKRCVHGVDKNPMAVELAKVALWLHTLTAGAPLSFLDHHLRCGDSLFGEWVRPVMDQIERKGALLIAQAVRRAEEAAAGMEFIENLTDADMAEAAESRSVFEDVEERTRALKGFLDFWHARRWLELTDDETRAVTALFDGAFGDPVLVAGGLRAPDAPSEEAMELFEKEGAEQASLLQDARGSARDYVHLRSVLQRAHRLAAEERFLHWQIAFPRVWHDWTSAERKGGFDAVIGNPPWDRFEFEEVPWFELRSSEIARESSGAPRKRRIRNLKDKHDKLWNEYKEASDRVNKAANLIKSGSLYSWLNTGKLNIYKLFVERALNKS